MTRTYRLGSMVLPLMFGAALVPPVWAQDAQPIYGAGAAAVAPQAPASDATARRDAPVAGGLQPIQSDQGVRYISGGVGEDERAALDTLSNQFNLRLMFARQGSGEYLAAVRVNILDAHGATVLTAESQGPWLFAQLPSGDYVVEASPQGPVGHEPQRKTAHVDGSRQSRLDFYWR